MGLLRSQGLPTGRADLHAPAFGGTQRLVRCRLTARRGSHWLGGWPWRGRCPGAPGADARRDLAVTEVVRGVLVRGVRWRLLLLLLRPHQEPSALDAAAQARDVLRDRQVVLVPLVVQAELFAREDLAGGEEPDGVVGDGVDLPSQVEGLHVRVAAVVDEAGLVAVEHAVQAEREELAVVGLLDQLLSLLALGRVIHVEEVREAVRVVVGAPHVALLLGHDLALVLHQEGARRYVFHRHESPHANLSRPLGHH